MLRSGRFRHRLLDDSFLQTKIPSVARSLSPFLELWKQKQLSDTEITAFYLLIFALYRRPQDFLGGELKELPISQNESSLPIEELKRIFLETLPLELRTHKTLHRIFEANNLINGFVRYSWRSVPESANRALLSWHLDLYPLKLTLHIPTPEQVLDLQCQGERCVSLLTDLNSMQSLADGGRDAWAFLIHDLIHADHFFKDSHKAQAQIHFSRNLKKVWQNTKIQMMLREDKNFAHEFDYLMSDMNSVPLHLLKTLKAILLGYIKRKDNRTFQQSLSPHSEEVFHQFFKEVISPWKFSEVALQAALRLNTPRSLGYSDDELIDQALSVQLFCPMNLGSSTSLTEETLL